MSKRELMFGLGGIIVGVALTKLYSYIIASKKSDLYLRGWQEGENDEKSIYLLSSKGIKQIYEDGCKGK
jgi:hypothetical protein